MERLDCHVFIPDDTFFEEEIIITGDLIAGNNVTVRANISVGGDVFFGDQADTYDIEAGCDVILGDYADIYNIYAGSDVTIGEQCNIEDITYGENITIGRKSCIGSITSY